MTFLDTHPIPHDRYPYYCVVHESAGMVGPITVQADPCPAFDADGYGDLDLRDFAGFQEAFTGSTAQRAT